MVFARYALERLRKGVKIWAPETSDRIVVESLDCLKIRHLYIYVAGDYFCLFFCQCLVANILSSFLDLHYKRHNMK